jgi:hypothetical protein
MPIFNLCVYYNLYGIYYVSDRSLNLELKPLPNKFDLYWCKYIVQWPSCIKASFILFNKSVEAQSLSLMVILQNPPMVPGISILV